MSRHGRRARRDPSPMNLAFLDVICCGFGAVILLLVLSKLGEPGAIERARVDLDGLIARLTAELFEIRGDTTVLERDLTARVEQLSDERAQIARLRGDLSSIQGRYAATNERSEVQDAIQGRLLAARQKLSEEMRRLQEQRSRPTRRPPDAPVGGIPVDSEYVVFVIDTSGSMQNYAWPLVVQKMDQVLDIYPRVKGIQVLNDMGNYMFSRYRRKWIPDTPARRKAILERLTSWQAFSNSSPVEGIEEAIEAFWAPDKRISIYVFGDEFTGDSVDDVVKRVRHLNRAGADGQRRVRIHAIGFPVMFSIGGVQDYTGVRFATLMRTLCEENGGTFVALNTTERTFVHRRR